MHSAHRHSSLDGRLQLHGAAPGERGSSWSPTSRGGLHVCTSPSCSPDTGASRGRTASPACLLGTHGHPQETASVTPIPPRSPDLQMPQLTSSPALLSLYRNDPPCSQRGLQMPNPVPRTQPLFMLVTEPSEPPGPSRSSGRHCLQIPKNVCWQRSLFIRRDQPSPLKTFD